MKTIQYLQNGGTLETLKEDFAISATNHQSGLVILNYCQIDSPKAHPIVVECRSLVLDSANNFNLVARNFPRFFNYGEVEDHLKFDWTDYTVATKEDGSLINIFCHKGIWYATTRSTFAEGKVSHYDITWTDLILKALNWDNPKKFQDLQEFGALCDPNKCYTFELVSLYNKIVRRYYETRLVLLAVFEGESELPVDDVDDIAQALEVGRPCSSHGNSKNSIGELLQLLEDISKTDPTFEGYVLRDRNNMRIKLKSKAYLQLHRMVGENKYHPRSFIPFIVERNGDELLTYYPELEKIYNKYLTAVETAVDQQFEIWEKNREIEIQKDFALAIKASTNPFASILFQTRKKHGNEKITRSDFRHIFVNHGRKKNIVNGTEVSISDGFVYEAILAKVKIEDSDFI